MKKFLSTIAILAMVLTLSLSLSSCVVLSANAEATIDNQQALPNDEWKGEEMGEPYRSLPRPEEEIRNFINNEMGLYGICKLGFDYTAPESLYLLYVDENNDFIAYVVIRNYAGEVIGETIARIYRDQGLSDLYLLSGDLEYYEYYDIALNTEAYLLSLNLSQDEIYERVTELIFEIYGRDSAEIDINYIENNGVEYIFYERFTNSYIAYIDTFNVGDYTTGVRALVLFPDGSFVGAIRTLYFKFSDNYIDEISANGEADRFFNDLCSGYMGDSAYVDDIDGCSAACQDFKNAIENAFCEIETLRPTGFESWVSDTFGPDSKPVYVVIGLVVVILAALLVITIILLPVTLVPILFAIIFFLFIIMIILAISKAVLKKRVKRLSLLIDAKKAEIDNPTAEYDVESEPEQAAEETTATGDANGENA